MNVNIQVEVGPELTAILSAIQNRGDLSLWAKNDCSCCNGKGWATYIMGGQRVHPACNCIRRRIEKLKKVEKFA